MTKKLFSEFDSVSSKQWKQKIQFDLKGADYNKTLVWNSNEDIAVKPFYHADDFPKLPEVSNSKATQWKICQTIYVAKVEKSNLKAIDIISEGVESIIFILPSEDIVINDLVKNIDLNKIQIHLELLFLSEKFTKNVTGFSEKIQIHSDIIGNLAKTGNWFNNLNTDFSKFETLLTETKSLSIDATLYQNAGANIIQQLAYALAHSNEYLNYINNNVSHKTKEVCQSLQVNFKVSICGNYFFEIAKIRALRVLWETLASEYNMNINCHIISTPSKRNKTVYDKNTNILRTTTESMSAILGGANTICNLPYDAIFHKNNKFGENVAKNQLLTLKYESYFDKVDNPTDGAYYIESLTNQFSEKALILFKEIEKNGGFLKQLKEGTIQRKIKGSALKEQEQFNTSEKVLVGINKYPNLMDTMKSEIEIYPFVKTKQRKTLIEPIIEKRLAEKLEQEQLKNEK